MRRRSFVGASIGSALAMPSIGRAQAARTLRFVPSTDVPVLDPVFSPGSGPRNHGFLVFDTLYGVDARLEVQPQMVAGHEVSDDGLTWTMTLREGLAFHDGEPVRPRDVVASVRRWASRDAFGGSLFGIVDELSGVDDRTLRWRLRAPFPKLPLALGKAGSICCFIMPERLAGVGPGVQVKELVGSGPFRFEQGEHVPGSLLVYARNAAYVPRPGGEASLLAGPKRVHFDRVEWRVIPDAATAAGALQRGEVDWIEQALSDLVPTLRARPGLVVDQLDPLGNPCLLRFNHLVPPFDNLAIRRAVMSVVDQANFMAGTIGDDRTLWRSDMGFFTPGSVMASGEGMAALAGPHDVARARQAIVDAGYKGERVVLMGAGDLPTIGRMNDIAADLLKRLGFNVDYVVLDWGSMLLRMANRNPIDKGGWNVFCVHVPGVTQVDPSAHTFLRAGGEKAVMGWPRVPRLEALRDAWFASTTPAEQRDIGIAMQREAFDQVPYVPLGTFYSPTAYRRELTGMLQGMPLFWNVRRS